MTQFLFAVMELGVCVVQTWRVVTHAGVAVAHAGMAVTRLPLASGQTLAAATHTGMAATQLQGAILPAACTL